jgi:hypothetical protein
MLWSFGAMSVLAHFQVCEDPFIVANIPIVCTAQDGGLYTLCVWEMFTFYWVRACVVLVVCVSLIHATCLHVDVSVFVCVCALIACARRSPRRSAM